MAKKGEATKEVFFEEFVKGSKFTIKDAPIKWAQVQIDNYDDKYDHKWKVDVVLDESWQKNLKKAGFSVYQDADGDWVLRVIRKVNLRDGTTQSPPTVVYKGGKFTDLIGNGSRCDIEVYAKYNKVSSNTYLNAYLNKITINDLIPYEGSADEVDFEAL